ncbi:MAG: restriction endonuclease [Nevskia sp.]|nr:restriction endonuclease [Nevskia sp.]
MPIPDYQTLMLPLLKLASDGHDHIARDSVELLAAQFRLSDDEKNLQIASGSGMFAGRVGWARTYLRQAGLLVAPKRGVFRITDAGKALLATNPERVDNKTLAGYDQFINFLSRSRDKNDEKPSFDASGVGEHVGGSEGPRSGLGTVGVQSLTPEEGMEAAYVRLRAGVEAEMLERIKAVDPAFFERLVIDLLVAMGYGGSRTDAGRAIGKSGDGGIDGIINEDRLGLDVIYVQAKRWEGTVGRPEIQKFAGALQGQRANKGVFITTSSFTREARDFAASITSKIILLDGVRLASLMIDHDVGVGRIGEYVLKRIDNDYFDAD